MCKDSYSNHITIVYNELVTAFFNKLKNRFRIIPKLKTHLNLPFVSHKINCIKFYKNTNTYRFTNLLLFCYLSNQLVQYHKINLTNLCSL